MAPDPVRSYLHELVKRAQSGDPRAIRPLREFIRAQPAASIALGGDLALETVRAQVRTLSGQNFAQAEAIFQKTEELRLQLAGESHEQSGIERLLVEEVVLAWLHYHRLELMYATQAQPTFSSDGYYQRELTAAHRRYLAAMRTLIDARRRPLPNIQINVADKQVNVAGDMNATAPKETPAPLG
jgi:hypothetical protein